MLLRVVVKGSRTPAAPASDAIHQRQASENPQGRKPRGGIRRAGAGGFFLASYDFVTNPENYQLDKAQKAILKDKTFHGNEIVANTR